MVSAASVLIRTPTRSLDFDSQSFVRPIFNSQIKPLVVWGDGEVIRDYFYASDLADLCALAVESTETGIFNAGSGQGTSINRMIELIGKATAIQPEVHYEPQRKFDVRETYLDISKARTAFGWEPVVDLESGISQHWDWLRSLS